MGCPEQQWVSQDGRYAGRGWKSTHQTIWTGILEIRLGIGVNNLPVPPNQKLWTSKMSIHSAFLKAWFVTDCVLGRDEGNPAPGTLRSLIEKTIDKPAPNSSARQNDAGITGRWPKASRGGWDEDSPGTEESSPCPASLGWRTLAVGKLSTYFVYFIKHLFSAGHLARCHSNRCLCNSPMK